MVASVACSCFPPPDPTCAPRGPSPVPPCACQADNRGEAELLPRALAHADQLAAQIAQASAEAATAMAAAGPGLVAEARVSSSTFLSLPSVYGWLRVGDQRC